MSRRPVRIIAINRTSDGPDTGPHIRSLTITAASGQILREPTTMDAAWIDPDDADRNRRTARTVNGRRAFDTLMSMHQRGNQITKRHLDAATALRDDYEFGVLGARPNGRSSVAVQSSGSGCQYPDDLRLIHLARYRHAMQAVGLLNAVILRHVILGVPNPDDRTIRSFAEKHVITVRLATARLIAAVDALAEHYAPEERSGIVEANMQAAAIS